MTRTAIKKEANNTTSLRGPDVVAQYFLRRLAMAYRDKPRRAQLAQHSNALAATMFLFVMLPIVGLANFVLLLSLRWTSIATATSFGNWPKIGMYSLVPISMVLGYLLLAKRLKPFGPKYSHLYTQFDTERDRTIARWLEFGAVVMAAAVLPFLGLFLAFGF